MATVNMLFAGFGGEAFTAYGRAVRALAPEAFVISAVCANGYAGYLPTAKAFSEEVVPAMERLRRSVDEAEGLMPGSLWPYPSYTDMLYY